MPVPTRFTNGLSTRIRESNLGSYPIPAPCNTSGYSTPSAPMGIAEYVNDFLDSVAEYTVSGSSSTFALANGLGGTALMTPGGSTTATGAYATPETMQFVSGQRMWYRARFQTSGVASTLIYKVGLQYGSATTDGIWFTKASGSTALALVSAVNSTNTTLVANVLSQFSPSQTINGATIDTAVHAAQYLDVGLYYDGLDLLVFAYDQLVARISAPTIGAANTYNLTNKLLNPFFQETPTATETMLIDYVQASVEVAR